MLVPPGRNIFHKKKFKSKPFLIVALLGAIIGGLFILRGVDLGTVKPLLAHTPTPTRSASSFILEAETQFIAGNLPAAIETYRKACLMDPENASLWAELARIQTYSITLLTTDAEKSIRIAEAQDSINKALVIAPDDPNVNAIHAFVLDWAASSGVEADVRQDYLAQAEQAAFRAITLDNTNALALAYYAEILADQARWVQAEQYVSQAVERNSSLMDVLRVSAYVQEALSNYTQAIEIYKQAIEITPNLTFLYLAVGANYRELGNRATVTATANQMFEMALDYFAQAVAINERLGILDPIPYLSISKTYSQMGEYFAAARNVLKALSFNYVSPDIYGQLGIVYFKSRNYEGSIPAFQCALEGCDAETACEVRQCDLETDELVSIEGMPLTDSTVVYYYTYGSVLSAMHRTIQPTCEKAMIILAQVRAKYAADVDIMSIVEAGEEICLSYGYQRISVTSSP